MGKTKRNKQYFRIRILVFSVLVCAWLLPTSVGIAASTSSNMKVTLMVEDSVGVNYGSAVLDSNGNQAGQVITEFVSRTASSRLTEDVVSGENKDTGESELVITVTNL